MHYNMMFDRRYQVQSLISMLILLWGLSQTERQFTDRYFMAVSWIEMQIVLHLQLWSELDCCILDIEDHLLS